MWHVLVVLLIVHHIFCRALCARVAVICFQKDDFELIEYWIRYHSELFGYKNVAVLDNFSQNASLLSRLEYWSSRGVHVLFKQGPYARKGPVTAEAFKKVFPDHDVAIPLDADEFLVSYRNGIPVVNSTIIHSDVDKFWASPYYCAGLRQYYSNYIPDNSSLETSAYTNNGPVYPADGCKHFGKLKNIVYLDHGNHQIQVQSRSGKLFKQESCVHELNTLGLLHYHNTSPYQALRRALSDCIGFKHLPANVTVENLLLFPALIEQLSRDLQVPNKTMYGRHKVHHVIQSYHQLLHDGSLHAHGASVSHHTAPKKLHIVGNFEDMIRILGETAVAEHSVSLRARPYTDYYVEPWYIRLLNLLRAWFI